jgi:molybdenum cofactor biosynthesis enzyme MoaA
MPRNRHPPEIWTHPRPSHKIQEIRLSITTACPLSCPYCYVKKDEQTMSFADAKKAVDLLLGSPGRFKTLKIYGGEPFSRFDLVKDIVRFSRSLARRRAKDLTIIPCTNGLLLTPDILGFLKKNKIRLAVSWGGRRSTHDEIRTFPDGRGSYRQIKDNLKKCLRILGPQNTTINLCVDADHANRIFDNFQSVIALGFNTVSIEAIQHYRSWTRKALRDFTEGMLRIHRAVLTQIPQGRFAFLSTVMREVCYQDLTKWGQQCLFLYSLEFHPSGDIGFSHRLLHTPLQNKKPFLAGSFAHGLKTKWLNCSHEINKPACRACLSSYYRLNLLGPSDFAPLALRNQLSAVTAGIILERAKNSSIYRRYIHALKERVKFQP